MSGSGIPPPLILRAVELGATAYRRGTAAAPPGYRPPWQSNPISWPALKDWKDVLVRTWKEAGDDNVGLLAAGVAFYAFLAFVPLLASAVLTYGLVADPQTVAEHIQTLARTLPREAAAIIADQLQGDHRKQERRPRHRPAAGDRARPLRREQGIGVDRHRAQHRLRGQGEPRLRQAHPAGAADDGGAGGGRAVRSLRHLGAGLHRASPPLLLAVVHTVLQILLWAVAAAVVALGLAAGLPLRAQPARRALGLDHPGLRRRHPALARSQASASASTSPISAITTPPTARWAGSSSSSPGSISAPISS